MDAKTEQRIRARHGEASKLFFTDSDEFGKALTWMGYYGEDVSALLEEIARLRQAVGEPPLGGNVTTPEPEAERFTRTDWPFSKRG